MRREGYKALVVDLDGTLIGRDERVSAQVANAVLRVTPKLAVTIASGREPSDVLAFAGQLGLTAPQISDNGAAVWEPSTGESLWSSPLRSDNAKEIVGALRREEVAFIATYPGGTFTHASDIDRWDLARVSALDMDEDTADRLAAGFGADPDLNAVKVSLPYNGLWAVDLTRTGVNKGTAVRAVADRLGIRAEQMIAVGDGYNDLPLLEACGLRIAMGNAAPELKAIADYVAPSVDDDGLAVAIDEFVLPRL